MKELKRGDTLQVTIEAATVDGTGIARVDGQVVFVPGALPGACAQGLIWGIMAIGVYLTYRFWTWPT